MDFTIIGDLQPLLYWTFFAYIILLFFSFGIKKIQKKFNGIEILFISGVVGTIFYFIFNYLILPTISELIRLWPTFSYALVQNYFAVNPFFYLAPYTPLTASNYVLAGATFILVTYVTVLAVFLIITKIIKYCLDPKNEIFTECERFKLIDSLNLKKIVVVGIPYLIITFAVIFYILSLGVQSCIVIFNKIKNGYLDLYVYHYPLQYFWIDLLYCLIIIFIGLFLGICLLYISWLIFYEKIKLFIPLINHISYRIKNIESDWKTLNNFTEMNDKRFLIWIKGHWKYLLVLTVILIILIFVYDFIWPCNCNNTGCVCVG